MTGRQIPAPWMRAVSAVRISSKPWASPRDSELPEMKGVQAVELLGMEVEIWSGELENKLFSSLPSKSVRFGTPGKRKGSGQRVMPGWGSGSVG